MFIADGNGAFVNDIPQPTGDINGEGISTHSATVQVIEVSPIPEPKKTSSINWLFWILILVVIGILVIKRFFIKHETVAKEGKV